MRKRGRKTLFRQEMIEEAYKLGALGLTMDEIADFWCIHRASLYRWAKKHQDFSDTIKKGKEEADMTVVQALLKKAKNGDITGIIFWLKNRHPNKWRDRRDVEHSGHVDTKVFFEELLTKTDEAKKWDRGTKVKSLIDG